MAKTSVIKALLYVANAFFLLLGLVAGVVITVDRSTAEGPHCLEPPSPLPTAAEKSPASGRAFILLIDSLRYETAINPQFMPALNEFLDTATFARMDTVPEAVTVPALRAAFTGSLDFRVLGFIDNFRSAARRTRSIFTELATQGGRSHVLSDSRSFAQFERDIAKFTRLPSSHDDEAHDQSLAVDDALESFESSAFHLVIAHVTFLDHAAHEWGVRHFAYKHAAEAVDQLVAKAMQRVRTTDTLIIMGDHGHTEEGRHSLDLDVPTLFAIRSPAFQPGEYRPSIHIAGLRTHIERALAISSPRQNGERYCEASHANSPDQSLATSPSHLAKRKKLSALVVILLTITCAASLLMWWIVSRSITKAEVGPHLFLSWLIAPTLLAIPFYPLNMLLAAMIALGSIFLATKQTTTRLGRLRVIAAMIALGMLTLAWGIGLEKFRHSVGDFSLTAYTVVWLVTGSLFLITSKRFGVDRVALVALGTGGILLYPGIVSYGFASIWAPLWLCWLGGIWLSRVGGDIPAPDNARPRNLFSWYFTWALVALVAQQYALLRTTDGDFIGFRPLIDGTPQQVQWQMAKASIASLIIFCDRRSKLLGLTLASLLSALVSRAIMGIPLWHETWILSAGSGLFFTTVILARLRIGPFAQRHLTTSIFVFSLLILYFYSVRSSADAHVDWLTVMAGLLLSTRLLNHSQAETESRHRHFLLALGVLAAGWLSLGFSATGLEWHFLYDFFAPSELERYALLLSPVIVIRYALPVIALRLTLFDDPRFKLSNRWVSTAIVLKIVTLLIIILGMSFRNGPNSDYVDGLVQLMIILVLAIGLV